VFGCESTNGSQAEKESSENGVRVRVWRLSPQEVEAKQTKSDTKDMKSASSAGAAAIRVAFPSAELQSDRFLDVKC
jgi:hypothetical protein